MDRLSWFKTDIYKWVSEASNIINLVNFVYYFLISGNGITLAQMNGYSVILLFHIAETDKTVYVEHCM